MSNSDDKKLIVFGTEISREAIELIVKTVTPSVQRVAEYGAINGWSENKIATATSAAARGIVSGVKAIVDSHDVKRGR